MSTKDTLIEAQALRIKQLERQLSEAQDDNARLTEALEQAQKVLDEIGVVSWYQKANMLYLGISPVISAALDAHNAQH